jgi:hypothetical protein
MKKLHLAIATDAIEDTVEDYSRRLNCRPCIVIPGQYALWRTDTLNLSVRKDAAAIPGELRHLGWEDPQAEQFSTDTDVNGILWERFNAQQQAEEIEAAWPGTDYYPGLD